MNSPCAFRRLLPALLILSVARIAPAEDWPTYRHDNRRSGITTEKIDATKLKEMWTWRSTSLPVPAWHGPAKWDAYKGIPKLGSMRDYDKAFHVSVAGGRVYFGSSADDSVHCIDVATGKTEWTYTTDGPIRVAPTIAAGKLYVGSDDGYAYCLDAATGELVWRFSPKPDTRRVVNNGKFISLWPVRTGVLVEGGTAYFAAGMLPWIETVLCAVDARTGKPKYQQKHAAVTMEGAFLTDGTTLFAPQGRVPPRRFNLANGAAQGLFKGGGGTFAVLTKKSQLHYGQASANSAIAGFGRGTRLVVHDTMAFLASDNSLVGMDAVSKARKWTRRAVYPYALALAGDVLFAGGHNKVVALNAKSGEPVWEGAVDGKAYGLAVASGSLFVSTGEGVIHCFQPDEKGTVKKLRADVLSGDGRNDSSLAMGPYVEFTGTRSAIVRWETAAPAPSSVSFSSADVTVEAPQGDRTEHAVKVTGLNPDTVYLYTILGLSGAAPAEERVVRVAIRADSEHSGLEAFRAMDGNPATIWHSVWRGAVTPLPHEIVVDLGKPRTITGFTYLPRPADCKNGNIKDYEVYLSNNADESKPLAKGTPIAKGTFPNEVGESVVKFDAPKKGRYFRLRALSNVTGQPTWAGIGELTLHCEGVKFVGGPCSSGTFQLDTFFNYVPASITEKENPYEGDADKAKALAGKVLEAAGNDRGLCVVMGIGDGRLAYELARNSRMRVVGVDADPARVQEMQRLFVQRGLYGRVTLHAVKSLAAVPFVGDCADVVYAAEASPEATRILRPGGRAIVGGRVITKPPSKGAGTWTHQYGGADNAAYGGEELLGARSVADLEVLWLGRPGPRYQPDRNGRKPAPLCVSGRLFGQGLQRIVAMSAFNGSVLWSLEIPAFGRFNSPRDCGNWCADKDFIYAAVKDRCWQIRQTDGKVTQTFRAVPGSKKDWAYDWGYIADGGPVVLGSATKKGTAFKNFRGGAGSGWYDAVGGAVVQKVCSDGLFAFDKASGKQKWAHTDGVIINSTITVGEGKVAYVTCRNPAVIDSGSRRIESGALWQNQFLVALDVSTGKKLWETAIDTGDGNIMFTMGYGGGRFVIVAAVGNGTFNVCSFKAADGSAAWRTDVPWLEKHHGGHMSRPAIVDDKVFVRPRVIGLADGKILGNMPKGGCGTYAFSKYAGFYRAGTVQMWDHMSNRTSTWARLRPGCWLSTVPACGLLLSPEAGGGCRCQTWLETSIVFIPKHR